MEKSNNIEKPLSYKMAEFRGILTKVISNSELPISVMYLILDGITKEIGHLADAQFENEKNQYINALENKNKTETKESVEKSSSNDYEMVEDKN